jgi:hypothetical protein
VNLRLWGVGAVLASAGFYAGCGTDATAPPVRVGRGSPPPRVSVSEVAPEREEDAPSVESLALLLPSLAPGMREVARGESPLPASIALPPREADVCFRAVFAATSAVVAALVDDAGRLLDVSQAGKQTLLNADGPVCLRRDHHARLEVQGAKGPVRYVLWMTP